MAFSSEGPIPKNIFITRANKGVGLELVKQFLKLGAQLIIATYRNPAGSEELLSVAKEDPRLHLLQFDSRQDCKLCSIFKAVLELVKEEGLNLLINNAGIFTENQSLCELDKNRFMEFFEVNTVAPLMLAKELLPLLIKGSECITEACDQVSPRAATIVNITSNFGSITSNDEGKYYYSRCCRAALNCATKNLSIDLREKNIIVVGINPGWVSSDHGPAAPESVEKSATAIIEVLRGLDQSKTGTCLDFTGTPIPW